MNKIKIEHNPDKQKLEQMGVFSWGIWEKEVSEFPWYYEEQETCYLLEGHVIVTPKNGEPVEIKKADLVTFPKDMSCTWNVKKDVRKHFIFK